MKRRLLWGAIAASFLARAGAGAAMPERDGVWAQTYVDRPADPAVRFGQLPNGLRYAILHNGTPAKQVSVRLLIGSGSIAESDAEQGLAHFIEHLAFRGSTHVADGELMRTLQRHGLTLGADSNAFTTQESTDYRFDLPQGDLDTVSLSLDLLRETASELTFSASSIDAERGVVLAEERQRDSPDLHTLQDRLVFLLGDRRAAHRLPIGQTKVIAAATPQRLREFYRAIYRPANATVVIVGDVAAAAVEDMVKAKFSDWAPYGPARTLDRGKPESRGLEPHLFVEPGATHTVQLAWTRPYDDEADTLAHRREGLINFFAAQIFNERLREVALAPSPPFFLAQLDRANLLKSANITTLGLSGPIGMWPTGLAALMGQQRRLIRDGVTPAELALAKAQVTTALTASFAGAATRSTPALANGLMNAALADRVFTSPAQDLTEYQMVEQTITTGEVDHAFARSFEGSGPLLFLASPVGLISGEQRLRDAFAAAMQAPIAAIGTPASTSWPYDHFGRPGRVVSRRVDRELGVTSVQFANGVDLLVKPTAFADDQILVDVRFGHGRLGLPLEQASAFWTLTSGLPLFVAGATAKLGATDLQRLLGDRVVGATLIVNDAAFDLQGRTRPQDFTRELQLLSAYIEDPGFRPEGFVRIKTAMAAAWRQIDRDPGSVLSRRLLRRLHSDDPRWSTVPDDAEIDGTGNTDLKALFRPELSSGPLGIVISGKVDVEEAIAAVAATFGALPPRPKTTLPQAAKIVRFPPPPPSPVVLAHNGRSDKAIAFAAWPTLDFYASPKDARAMIVAMEVLRARLTDEIREADGLTYSPGVETVFSEDLPGYGFVDASIEIAPEKIDTYFARLDAIVADLGLHAVDADELDRAKRPNIEQRRHSLELNEYWLGALAKAIRDPREFAIIKDRVSAIETVSADDVRRVAATYLQGRREYRLIVRPAPPPALTVPKGRFGAVAACSADQILACQPPPTALKLGIRPTR